MLSVFGAQTNSDVYLITVDLDYLSLYEPNTFIINTARLLGLNSAGRKIKQRLGLKANSLGDMLVFTHSHYLPFGSKDATT